MVISAATEQVWELISDVTTIVRFHPTVWEVDLLSEQASGRGAARRCHFTDGTDVREVVTASEPNRRLHIELSEFSMPMNKVEAEWLLEPGVAPGTTKVTFEIQYEMKLGILGKALGALAVNGKLRQVTESVLAGLEKHLSTGELIGPQGTAA
ncbi:MAG: SRPBCC family protein [Proteobacteria bacterium]|nr:SRPBCC family protein [Pseudomonadota bacterium]